jgi:hypothetical protein
MSPSLAVAAPVLACCLSSAAASTPVGPQAKRLSAADAVREPAPSVPPNDRTTHAGADRALSSEEWPRLTIGDPLVALAMRQTLGEASRRFAAPRCQAILIQFHDARGRSLAERLEEIGVDIQKYLRLILFHDRTQGYCRGNVAYTAPGSRVVFVCPGAVERHWLGNRKHLVITIIHEVLHTLGLGEDPPSSAEIDKRVRQGCY